ncbi:Crp/Fnr family transcriptional regulator [Phytohalomonas tamaricis]|uniref:Crp/Fnr family transcriptional regulator n=1 Tax=Phytohalomonas tamaricis TaxID=2081032 RepID=UPI000D0B332B|nr:Crp/Fnr family transcriptional regulator [Phytohalomonas tamaricis]
MITPLIYKLERFRPLSDADRQLLADAFTHAADIPKHQHIITEGEQANEVHLLVEGWACRYKLLPNGKRHIVAYLMPGDLCDIHVTLLKRMDHSIMTLTPAKVMAISHDRINELLDTNPALSCALLWSTSVDEATLREWLVNIGSRSAEQRLAHLFCELMVRSRAAGIIEDSCMTLPLTQDDMGDAMGLTAVHTNRVLQKLRREGLIELKGRRLIIHDWERLTAFSEFDPAYLHLESY